MAPRSIVLPLLVLAALAPNALADPLVCVDWTTSTPGVGVGDQCRATTSADVSDAPAFHVLDAVLP